MLKLYGASASPFVRKAMLTLEYKALAYESIAVNPFAPPPDWPLISPLKKIPVLQDGDLLLPDSTVICRYLEDAYPTPSLYPANAGERAYACWLEEFGDTRLIEAVAPFFFERFVRVRMLGQAADEARLAHVMAEVLPPAFEYLERVLPAHGFAVGGVLSIADLSIASPMRNAVLAGVQFDAGLYPKVVAHYARITALPVFKARIAKETEDLAQLGR